MAKTYIVGGTGTMADASNDNGGGHDDTYTGEWTSLMAANGGPTFSTAAGGTVSWDNTNKYLSHDDAEGISNLAVGMLIHVHWETEGTEDWYPILSIVASQHIDIGEGIDIADEDPSVVCGGALAKDDTGIQQALDMVVAEDTTEICCNQDDGTTYPIGAELATNASSDGMVTALLIMKGVDHTDGSDLDATSKYPKLQASVNMASILKVQSQYWRIDRLHFDGNAKTFTTAGVQVIDYYIVLYNCLSSNIGSKDGFNATGSVPVFIGCEAWDCGGKGFYIDTAYVGTLISCAAHECGSGGIQLQGGFGTSAINCRAYNNTGYGLFIKSYGGSCIGNVTDNNSTHGIQFDNLVRALTVCNNSATNNTTNGFDGEVASLEAFALFANNHSFNNSAHSNMCDDGDWADLFDGNNITGDPLFRGDETDGDYYPQSGSPLLEAGWPMSAGYEENQDAIALYQSIGVWARKFGRPEVKGSNL